MDQNTSKCTFLDIFCMKMDPRSRISSYKQEYFVVNVMFQLALHKDNAMNDSRIIKDDQCYF